MSRPFRFLPLVFAAVLCAPAPALTQEPAAEPKIVRPAEAATGYIVVTDEKAEVTAGPMDDAAVLETAAKGDVFPLQGKQGSWYFVSTGEGRQGWIHGEAAALFFYPEYLTTYRPPEDWKPPAPGWVPPPGWAYPPGWEPRPRGWYPPPRWRPSWWELWYVLRDDHRLAPRRHHGPDWRPREPRRPPR